MDQAVPKRDDLPLRRRVPAAQGWRQTAGGFSDDFEVANDGILNEPLPQQHLAAAGNIGLDRRDAVRDVLEKRSVGFHNGRASASM